MPILTDHWSATQNANCPEYHTSTWSKIANLAAAHQALIDDCYRYAMGATHGPLPAAIYDELKAQFSLQKNDPLALATAYGTFHLNHDPRDGSPDIEVSACSMGGEHVGMTGPWGIYPFTAAHAVYLAQVNARICHLEGIDPLAHFDASVDPNVLQNGPIYCVSTHAERAIQTQDWGDGAASLAQSQKYGYGPGSGDPDMRWDIAVIDIRDAHKLAADSDGSYTTYKATAIATAKVMRGMTKAALNAGFPDGMWGLDK